MDFTALLVAAGCAPVRRPPWLAVGEPHHDQGWKLHVSAPTARSAEVLAAVLPALRRAGQPFKVAASPDDVADLNAGLHGATQVGKFVTVYLDDPVRGRELAEELVAATEDYPSPEVAGEKCLGRSVYARHGAFRTRWTYDRLGRRLPAREDGRGRLVPDERGRPSGEPGPLDDLVRQRDERTYRGCDGVARTSSGSLYGPGYLLLDRLRGAVKGSVFVALDLRDPARAATVVVKQGRRGVLGDRHGRDMLDRIAHQHDLLRRLDGTGMVPRAVDLFHTDGCAVLVTEEIGGTTLEEHVVRAHGGRRWAELPVRRRLALLELLRRVADTVVALHGQGVVHRDLTPGNVLVRSRGGVVLNDLELACDSGATRAFDGATEGFAPPEQLRGAPPAPADDAFALGRLALFVVGGLDPRSLPPRPDAAVLQAVTGGAPAGLLDLVRAATAPRHERPGPAELAGAVAALRPQAPTRRRRSGGGPTPEDARRAVRGLLEDCDRDPDSGLWRSPDVGGHDPTTPGPARLQFSAATGVAGGLYLLGRAVLAGVVQADEVRAEAAAVASRLTSGPVEPALPGLHHGRAGIRLALDVAAAAGLIPRPAPEPVDPVLDWPDVTHGAAGIGTAALTPGPEDRVVALRCADHLVATQSPDGDWVLPGGAGTLSGLRPTGFAHGTAGMAWYLSRAAAATGDPRYRAAAERGLDLLLSLARPAPGGGLVWPYAREVDRPWHVWCHGGPGIALALLGAAEALGRVDLVEPANRALRHLPSALAPNLSQCHGLAGLGEVHLEAARVLDDRRHLARARRIGEVLVALARPGRTGTTWRVQHETVPNADLMTGCAGVAHFLIRLTTGHPFGPPLHGGPP